MITGNTFNPRQFERPGTIRFLDSSDCLIASSTLHKFTAPDGALVLEGCDGFTISSLNLSNCASGIVLRRTTDTTIANCRITRPGSEVPLSLDDSSKNIKLSGNNFTLKP